MLWQQSERVRALGKRGSGRSGSARKKRRRSAWKKAVLSALLPSRLRIFRPTIATMMMLAAGAWLPARPLPRKAVHLRLGGPVMTDSDLDMDLLSSRIRDHKAGLMDCKLYVIVQSMVPGQRITVTAPPELVELFTVQELPKPVVVLGRDRMAVHTILR